MPTSASPAVQPIGGGIETQQASTATRISDIKNGDLMDDLVSGLEQLESKR